MATREPAFASPDEERDYLTRVKGELDAARTKEDVVRVWRAHYLRIGHRKLGRLLLGRSVDEVMRGRGAAS
ncbi:MAG: hypothetical protein QN141_09080 [Armatimonadota bacterium]|nr:hypothetical protein [Armatimonadota bacterium]MDR7451812.1 hypothetical protein [Armatimonadota bacterium]MDR7467537.1 hypothetical protein [Armatimonadota bacterium]MDR7494502.1 hypothetical protein [Armatimonadota bacterium]MDR7499763.1 hypothetical protein [Armatimonadota bacterium]